MTSPIYQDRGITLYCGDALDTLRGLPDGIVQCCVTSPPYWGLRDYGHEGQIGLEESPDAYVTRLVAVFSEVRRVLRDDGVLWLNLGDSYSSTTSTSGGYSDKSTLAGFTGEHTKGRQNHGGETKRIDPQCKPKDLVGIPWLIAFALRADGWYLRSDIIWAKPNPMPESVTDRPTRSHEYVFLFSKSARYFYDAAAIAEPASYVGVAGMDESGFKNAAEFNGKHGEAAANGSQRRDKQRGHSKRHAGFNDRWDAMSKAEQCSGTRNKRSVWTIATHPYAEAHFATYPESLVEPCILAGSAIGDIVLDPFNGSGTTGAVAERLGRKYIGIELNPEYIPLTIQRLAQPGLFATDATESSAPQQTIQQEMFR